MEEREEIGLLMMKLKAAGVRGETALNISLRVDEGDKRARMIAWLENHPDATVQEICTKTKELHREQIE